MLRGVRFSNGPALAWQVDLPQCSQWGIGQVVGDPAADVGTDMTFWALAALMTLAAMLAVGHNRHVSWGEAVAAGEEHAAVPLPLEDEEE